MSRQGPTPRRRTVIRYVDSKGNRVPKGTPGCRREKAHTDTYYAKLGGKWVSLGTTDLGAAWTELRRLQREGADPVAEHRRRPLDEHIDAFARHLEAKGTAAKGRAGVLSDLRRIAQAAAWGKLADLTADSLQAYLRQAQHAGRSPQTRKSYLRHVSQFTRWCVRTGRLPANPLAELKPPNVDVDRRHIHRCPTDEELAQLWAYLDRPTCPARRGMSGPQRLLGYRLCLGTGFRAGELRELRRNLFDLEGATVTLPARHDKRGKPVVQPLPAWLVAELRAWFAAGGGCWERFPEHDPGQVLQEDVTAAGLRYEIAGPDGPERLGMHALRVRYITDLCMDPANTLKTVMQLARHSDPKLTMKIYAKCRPQVAKAAVDRLPRPGG